MDLAPTNATARARASPPLRRGATGGRRTRWISPAGTLAGASDVAPFRVPPRRGSHKLAQGNALGVAGDALGTGPSTHKHPGAS